MRFQTTIGGYVFAVLMVVAPIMLPDTRTRWRWWNHALHIVFGGERRNSMMKRTAYVMALLVVPASFALAQQGSSLRPDTAPSQGVNAGGPVGTQAVQRPGNAIPDSVGRDGQDCQKMTNTVSGKRPAASGASEPQPQQKCEGK